MHTDRVWFVTGASKGLGADLIRQLLAEGYRVAGTSRNRQALIDLFGERENFLPLTMDVTSNEDVKRTIGEVIDRLGRIDVVVNNAGYTQMGTVEELTAEEVQRNFDVNVFGPLHVIRNAAPYLRTQRSGHIINIASIGGFAGNFLRSASIVQPSSRWPATRRPWLWKWSRLAFIRHWYTLAISEPVSWKKIR